MPTPSIQTLRADAQQVLNLDSISAVRSVVAATLANANAGTPLNPNLTTQQLWNEFYQIVTQPKSDIESIIANQLMKFLFAPPAPGGASANGQVIFNDGGVLAGDAGLTYDKTNDKLTVDGVVEIWRGLNQNGTSTAVGLTTLAATTAGAAGNTALGFRAMYRSTSGSNNVGVGASALSAPLTGSNNVAVGLNAGAAVTLASNAVGIGNNALNGGQDVTGADNVAIGNAAMYADGSAALSGGGNIGVGISAARRITTGSNNIGIGSSAMFSASSITGADNIGIGRDTFRSLTTANYSVAIGHQALNALTSGGANTAVGKSALRACVTGANNTAIGYDTLYNYTGNNCTAVGNSSGNALTTGSENTAIGAGSLYACQTGTRNVAVGYNACVFGTSSYNTCIGAEAGSNALFSGTGNIFIGDGTGGNTTTGQSNICVGIGAQTTGATASNQISFGSATYYVGTNGAANTYYAAAGASLGYWRVIINGTARKIQVFADA
jgi:hypothetical protein